MPREVRLLRRLIGAEGAPYCDESGRGRPGPSLGGRGRRRGGQEGRRVHRRRRSCRRLVGLGRNNAVAAAVVDGQIVAVDVELALGERVLLSDVLAVPPDPAEGQGAGLAVPLLVDGRVVVGEGVLVPEDARAVIALLDEDVEGVVEADVVQQGVLVLGGGGRSLELGAHAACALQVLGQDVVEEPGLGTPVAAADSAQLGERGPRMLRLDVADDALLAWVRNGLRII